MGAIIYMNYVNGCMKCKRGEEVIIGAKNIEEWWEQDVEWIIRVDVEVKNDGKSTLGKESLMLEVWRPMVIEPGIKDYEK